MDAKTAAQKSIAYRVEKVKADTETKATDLSVLFERYGGDRIVKIYARENDTEYIAFRVRPPDTAELLQLCSTPFLSSLLTDGNNISETDFTRTPEQRNETLQLMKAVLVSCVKEPLLSLDADATDAFPVDRLPVPIFDALSEVVWELVAGGEAVSAMRTFPQSGENGTGQGAVADDRPDGEGISPTPD